jgi:hypothetical protein
MTQEEQVLIRGKCFLYRQKAPFVPSGHSVHGALEYNEAREKIRCHECGEWYQTLSQHLGKIHKISAAEYKDRHGLRRRTPLWAPTMSARMSQRIKALLIGGGGFRIGQFAHIPQAVRASVTTREAKAFPGEMRNEHGTCQAQILNRLRELSEKFGRTPSKTEIEASGLMVKSACLALNVKNLGALVSLVGLLPRKPSEPIATKYSPELLIELLRDFYVKHGRLPGKPDHRMRLLPSRSTYRHHFGSMAAAYEAAGLSEVAAAA